MSDKTPRRRSIMAPHKESSSTFVSLSTLNGYLCSSPQGFVKSQPPSPWTQWAIVTLSGRFVRLVDSGEKILTSDADGRVFTSKKAHGDQGQVWSLLPVPKRAGYKYFRNETSGMYLSIRAVDHVAECVPETNGEAAEMIISMPVVAGELKKKGSGFRGLRIWSSYFFSFNNGFLGYWKTMHQLASNAPPIAQFSKENIVTIRTHPTDKLRFDIILKRSHIVKGQQVEEDIVLELKAENDVQIEMWLNAFNQVGGLKTTVKPKKEERKSMMTLTVHHDENSIECATTITTSTTDNNKDDEKDVENNDEKLSIIVSDSGDEKEEKDTTTTTTTKTSTIENKNESKDENKTLSLSIDSEQVYNLPSQIPDSPYEVLRSFANNPGELLSVNGKSTIDMMMKGKDFSFYAGAKHNPKQISVQEIRLFYEKDVKMFYWLDREKEITVKKEHRIKTFNSFSISDLRIIRIGKQKDIAGLSGWQARVVNDELCITFCVESKNSTKSFSFSAMNSLDVCAFLFGIHHLLVSSNSIFNRIPITSKSSSRMKYAIKDIHYNSSDSIWFDDVKGGELSLEEGLKLNVGRPKFSSSSGELINVEEKVAFLFVESEQSDRLFWCDASATLRGAAKQVILLSDIVQICTGNAEGTCDYIMQKKFSSRKVKPMCCVSIYNKNKAQSVILGARSPRMADFIVYSINLLLKQQKKKLQLV